jgi:hypothetical protein
MRIDWKSLSTLDRAIVGGAAVAFIALFLPWWGVGAISFSVDGWSAGFTAWAGGLLLTAAGVLLLLRRSGATLSFGGAGPAVVVAAVSALGLLLVIIRWASLPRYQGFGVGAKYGLYIALIAGLVEVTAAVMAMRASGEQMPWAHAQAAGRDEPGTDAPAAPEE